MSTPTDADIINAAASVATDAAEGRLSPADLERHAVQELSALMLTEPDDGSELWELQTEIARRVLARGALPADEISEWAAVQRRRENPYADADSAAVLPLDDPEPSQGGDALPHEDSTASGAHSDESEPTPDELMVQDPEPDRADVAESAPMTRGPKFGGTIAARGRDVPSDCGLTVLR